MTPRAVAIATLVALAACQTSALRDGHPHAPVADYDHSRYDYFAFRARVGDLPEPNYLPYLAHPKRLPDGERALVLCRWPDDAFPLRYHVEAPEIDESLQDRFHPRHSVEYLSAVEEAFADWAAAIGRPVRFRAAASADQADIRVHLRTHAPHGSRLRGVLPGGRVRGGRNACRVEAVESGRARIRYALHEVELFVSDGERLRSPHDVRAVALHEIGHVLGASNQHSPVPTDVMSPVLAGVDALSELDENSLRALYQLEPGTVYVRPAHASGERPMKVVRRRPARVGDLVRDGRHDLELRFPVGWEVVRTGAGWMAVDGLGWDHDASLEVMVVAGELAAKLGAGGLRAAAHGELVQAESFRIDGRPVHRVVTRIGERTQEATLLQVGDDESVLLFGQCPTREYPLYQPWFSRVLLSVEPVTAPEGVGLGYVPPDD